MKYRLYLVLCGSCFVPAAFPAAAFTQSKAPRSVQEQLLPMDTDKDGKLSAAEHATGARALFRTMDTDRDDKVSTAEMDTYQKEADPGSIAGGMWSVQLKTLDADGDGMLDAQEHAAASRAMFERMDTDRDESVSLAEMQAMDERMKQKSR